MNKPLVTTISYIEGVPLNIKMPLKSNQNSERAKFLSKLYFENSLKEKITEIGPISSNNWKAYLKITALHVQSLSLAMQINTDTYGNNHKYLAHQVASVYVLLILI